MKIKSLTKIGILILMLIVPVFVFLFLKFFGKNHYKVRTYFPIETRVNTDNSGKQYIDTVYYKIPNTHFITQSGKNESLYDSNKKLTILNFFFTRCPGICPKMMSNLSRLQETFLNDTLIQIISVTVDPEYDTHPTLAAYGKKYNANEVIWKIVHMKKQESYKFGFYGLKLPADTIDKTLHSEKLVLVDKDFHIRGYYAGTKSKEVERLITEIKIIQKEEYNGFHF